MDAWPVSKRPPELARTAAGIPSISRKCPETGRQASRCARSDPGEAGLLELLLDPLPALVLDHDEGAASSPDRLAKRPPISRSSSPPAQRSALLYPTARIAASQPALPGCPPRRGVAPTESLPAAAGRGCRRGAPHRPVGAAHRAGRWRRPGTAVSSVRFPAPPAA